MKRFFILLGFMPLALIGQMAFTPLGEGVLPAGYTLNCIHPLNQDLVWTLASQSEGRLPSLFCLSTDGGQTWKSGSIDTAVKGFALDLFAQSDKIAYANLEDANGSTRWYKTLDGGNTWYKLAEYLGNTMYMYNMTEGVMAAGQAGIYSSDSFNTYTVISSSEPGGPPKGYGLRLLSGPNSRCVNDSGVYFTYPKGYIVRTQNKGRSWQGLRAGSDTLNSTCGLAASGNVLVSIQWEKPGVAPNSMSRSLNGGNTWEDISATIPQAVQSPRTITHIPGQAGWFVLNGYNEFFLSKDSAKTWQRMSSASELMLSSGVCAFGSANTGWLGMLTEQANAPFIYKCTFVDISKVSDPAQTGGRKAYPNPASSTVYWESLQAGTYTLLDANGKKICEGLLIAGENRIDTQGLAAGVYYLSTCAAGNCGSMAIQIQ